MITGWWRPVREGLSRPPAIPSAFPSMVPSVLCPTWNGGMNTNQGERSASTHRIDGLIVAGPVGGRGPARLAKALTTLSTVLLVLAVVLLVLNRDLGFGALSPHLVLVPGFAVVGLVLASRDRHPSDQAPARANILRSGTTRHPGIPAARLPVFS
jgi:hypothetical protein